MLVAHAQSYLTLCNPMDCSPPGSSVHGIFPVIILGGLPFPTPGDLPNLGSKTKSPALQSVSLPAGPLVKPRYIHTHVQWMVCVCEENPENARREDY